MSKQQASLINFPGRTLLLDDDPIFLRQLRSTLLKNQCASRAFAQPKQALDELLKKNLLRDFLFDYIVSDEKNDLSHPKPDYNRMRINFRKLYHLIYNPKRFDCYTTLMIDQVMPTMNGVEFIKLLREKKLNCRKYC